MNHKHSTVVLLSLVIFSLGAGGGCEDPPTDDPSEELPTEDASEDPLQQ